VNFQTNIREIHFPSIPNTKTNIEYLCDNYQQPIIVSNAVKHVRTCTEDYGHRLLPLSTSLILTIIINSCQTFGFSKVGAIIKYNIMHFPVLIKTVLKLVYIIMQSKSKAKQRCVMGVGMCLYAQLMQTKNKQCKSAIILQCYHPHSIYHNKYFNIGIIFSP